MRIRFFSMAFLALLFVPAVGLAQVTFLEIDHPAERFRTHTTDNSPPQCPPELDNEPNQYLNAFSLVVINSPERDSRLETNAACAQLTDQVVVTHSSGTGWQGLGFQAVPGAGETEDTPTWLDLQIDREVYLRAYNVEGHTDVKGAAKANLDIRVTDLETGLVIFEQRFVDYNAIQDVELDYFPPPGHALIDPVPETYHVFTPFTEAPRNWRIPMKAGSRFSVYIREYQYLTSLPLDPLKPGNAARAKTGWAVLFGMSPRTE